MRALVRPLLYVALSLALPDSAGYSSFGQSKETKPPSASISGRVTLNGKPASSIPVILTRNDMNDDGTPVAKATTDEEGRFRIPEAPAGSFRLIPFAPAFVFDDRASFGQPGKVVTITSGEAVEDIDLSLRRGGVITGKVTDSAGRPVVEQTVTLTAIDGQSRQSSFDPTSWGGGHTDDRGVYRIFGVPEGRYIASVGEPPRQPGPGPIHYPLTYHPGVTDDAKANVIELGPGTEATGVDITLGLVGKGFTASGRTVDAVTGKPVPSVSCGYGFLFEGRGVNVIDWVGTPSDAQGNFRIHGLTAGHYAAFLIKDSESEYYSDVTAFDINDADVSGLEIRVHRGSGISGVAVIEGFPDRDAAERQGALRIYALTPSKDAGVPFSRPSKLGPDGSFRITGLRPGKVKFSLGGFPAKGFLLTRVERDGVEQPGGSFDIATGEQVSGVRLMITYGAGVIRGQLKIAGGALPAGMKFGIKLNRLGTDTNRFDWWTETDDRNRFLFENLAAGDYEVTVTADKLPEVKKQVTVTSDGESEVTIVIDLSSRNKDN